MSNRLDFSPLILDLPPGIAAAARIVAQQTGVTPEKLIIDVLKDAFAPLARSERTA